VQKNFLAKEMDARVISAPTRVFDALLPAHDAPEKAAAIEPDTTTSRPTYACGADVPR
jgi:hypothetical protein